MRGWEKYLRVVGWGSEYVSVDRFLRHYGRKVRSEKTRENVGLTLKGFCEYAGKDPDELVKLASSEASGLVQDYVDSLARRGCSVRYVNVCLAFLQTFFRTNDFEDLKVERHYQPSRYRKRSEYIPSGAEIHNMAFSSGSLRNKALVFALYTSGLRNSTLRALLYGDVREELEKGLDIVKLPVYAEMKKVDSGACKGNIPYYSFISKEATDALRQYCEKRRKTQEDIADDEPLFSAESTNVKIDKRRRIPVMKKSLEDLVRRAAWKAGIKRWQDVYPHCLRKAFESALRNAGLDLKDQEFLMGHILPGSQDAYYDKTKVEDLRRKYEKVNFFPERGYLTEDSRKRQIIDTAKILGYSEDRIKKIEEALAKYENVDEALEEIKKLSLNSHKQQEKTPRQLKNNGLKEIRVIKGEATLVKFLQEGWDIIRELSDDRIVVQKNPES